MGVKVQYGYNSTFQQNILEKVFFFHNGRLIGYVGSIPPHLLRDKANHVVDIYPTVGLSFETTIALTNRYSKEYQECTGQLPDVQVDLSCLYYQLIIRKYQSMSSIDQNSLCNLYAEFKEFYQMEIAIEQPKHCLDPDRMGWDN